MPKAMHRAIGIALSAAWTAGAAAQGPVTFDRARTEKQIARSEPLAAPVPVTTDAGVEVKPAAGLLYRIHFTIDGVSATGWTIEVSAGGKSWTSAPLDPAVPDVWSNELTTQPPAATVRLTGTAAGTPPRVAVDRVAIRDERPTPQAITPPGDQSQSISRGSARIKQWGKSVARLEFIGADGNGYYCTAFLISAALMMTNNHCINTDAEMRSAIAEFDYDAPGANMETRRFKELVAHDDTLDYSVIRLAEPSARAALPLADVALAEKKGLLIIEHPGGEPKKFSRIDCQVRGVELPGLGGAKTDFGHFCDTLGGSSGSPIQDFPTGTVLGLHHLGFQPGDNLIVNRGVKIGLILADLAQRKPAARAEIATP